MSGFRVHHTNATRRPFSRRRVRHNSNLNPANQTTTGAAAAGASPLTRSTSNMDLNGSLQASPTEIGRLPLLSLSTIPEESSTILEDGPLSASDFEDIEDSDSENNDETHAQQNPEPPSLTFRRNNIMTVDEMSRSGRFNSSLSNSLTPTLTTAPTDLTFFSTMQQDYSNNPFAATFDDDSDDYPSSPESASRPKPPKKKSSGTSPTPSMVVNSVRNRLEGLDRDLATKLKISPEQPNPANYSMPNVIASFKSKPLPDHPVHVPSAPLNRYVGYAVIPEDEFKPEQVLHGGFKDTPGYKTPIDLSRTSSIVSLTDRNWIAWAIKEPIPKQNPFPEHLYGPW